jgi:hypothetical protein
MKNITDSKRKNRRVSANGTSHQAVPPVKALQEVQGTQILVGSGIGQITLKFDPSLEFVIVQFKCPNENIEIECGGEVGDECGFPLEFKQGDQREATFDIRARAVEKESEEPLDICCQDKNGKALGNTRRFWIKLKPETTLQPPDNFNILAWIIYVIRLGRQSRLLYLLLVVVLAVPLFIYRVPPTDKILNWVQRVNDYAQIKLGTKDPYHYTQPWSDPFLPTEDNRPDQSKWLAPKEWVLVNGENDSDTNKALKVDAEGVGFNKLPSDLFALYDYEVTFPLNISENQHSAMWVVRAQSQQDYYLFELTLPTNDVNELKLEGYVYANGIRGQRLTEPTPVSLEFFKFHEGDFLTVTITVNNYEFKHAFNLNLHEEDDENNPNFYKQGNNKIKTFIDINSKYRYGAFGFQAQDRTNAFKVEWVEIGNTK